jgi:WD40 repeat protein
LYAINPFPEGFITGGKDGVLKIWNKEWDLVNQITIGNYNLRSIDYDNGKIVVGTQSSEIFEILYNGKDKPAPNLLIEGHGEGELWGLGVHPNKHIFATASDDKQIKVWNGDTKKSILSISAKFEARSCGFSPDGSSLVVGFLNGSFSVYSLADGKELFHKKVREQNNK